MEHLNVRFYGARFSEAERYARTHVGLPEACSQDDNLQFTHELRPGALLRVESTRTGDSTFQHTLFAGGREEPAATLCTQYEHPVGAKPIFEGYDWIFTGLRAFGPTHLMPTGELTREALLGMVNQAAVHLLDNHRQRDGAGRLLTGSAVRACRIRRFVSATSHVRLAMQSRIGLCGRTSVLLQHQLLGEASGEVLAEIEVTSVFFDMNTRRSCSVPPTLRAIAVFNNTSTDAPLPT